MKSRSLTLLLSLQLVASLAIAQSETTEALQKKYDGSLALFFYNNTLRMLNQTEDKAFDELIKDIEKMKLLMIKKNEHKIDASGYKKLVSDYKAEAFEEIMTSRFEGKSFDIFLKEKDGKTKGMLVLVNDDQSLFVLDIIGSIALNNVTKLYDTIDKSSDIGKKIRSFTGDGDNDDKDKDEDDEDNAEKSKKKN